MGIVALVAAVASLGISGGVAIGSVTSGAAGLEAETHDLAGLLVIVALIALGLARTQRR